MASAEVTIDHAEIRRWVEERGGYPARVKRTGGDGDTGILRIDYPGFSGRETLERISWDEFFKAFEENNLAFLYQAEDGSRFSKFVHRGSAGKRASKKRAATKGSRKTSSKKR
jgi:hypothetical protein